MSVFLADVRAFRRDPLAWVCVPLLLGAMCLPFINLGVTPFWVDESIAVMPARNIHFDLLPTSPYDLDVMPYQVQRGLWDPATPLYRYSVAAFTAVVGFSEGSARAFSVIMGLLSIIPFYALVRKLDGRRTALLAVTFLVTSPAFIVHAREARHQTFVMFLALCAFYYLYTATEGRDDRSRALWVVFVVATLLSQTLGYGILPIVAVYVLVNGPHRFFARRHLPVYLVAGAVYLAIVGTFWQALPFFHDVTCSTRADCRPMRWFYLAVLYAFTAPMTGKLEEVQLGLSVIPIFFVIGVVVLVNAARRAAWPLEKTSLLLAWFFLPLLLLSMNDVKFDRYLFIWVMPLCALFLAYGVRWLLRLPGLRNAPGLGEVALVVLIVSSPQYFPAVGNRAAQGPMIESGLVRCVRTTLLAAPRDNFEQMRWQANYLQQRVRPGDVVVSSLDDASLQYYLGQFVYGFLNSRRSDEFFVELLDDAERAGTRVWFVDHLDKFSFCVAGEPEPLRIDCRAKYPKFYARCTATDGGASDACMRLRMH